MKHEVLQSFLIDVRDRGSARIEKKKLAWMLGRLNLNQSAYQLLLDEWHQIAWPEQLLLGFEGGTADFTFVTQMPTPVKEWT